MIEPREPHKQQTMVFQNNSHGVGSIKDTSRSTSRRFMSCSWQNIGLEHQGQHQQTIHQASRNYTDSGRSDRTENEMFGQSPYKVGP